MYFLVCQYWIFFRIPFHMFVPQTHVEYASSNIGLPQSTPMMNWTCFASINVVVTPLHLTSSSILEDWAGGCFTTMNVLLPKKAKRYWARFSNLLCSLIYCQSVNNVLSGGRKATILKAYVNTGVSVRGVTTVEKFSRWKQVKQILHKA